MNWRTLLIALVGCIFLAPSAFAIDETEKVSDRLAVVEAQLDYLIELMGGTNVIKICHVPNGNHMQSSVILVPAQAVNRLLVKSSFDYVLPPDTELEQGDWCDPYAGY